MTEKLTPLEIANSEAEEDEEYFVMGCGACGSQEMIIAKNTQGMWIECGNCETVMRQLVVHQDERLGVLH